MLSLLLRVSRWDLTGADWRRGVREQLDVGVREHLDVGAGEQLDVGVTKTPELFHTGYHSEPLNRPSSRSAAL